jgi:hypothetical protein
MTASIWMCVYVRSRWNLISVYLCGLGPHIMSFSHHSSLQLLTQVAAQCWKLSPNSRFLVWNEARGCMYEMKLKK